MVEINNKIKFAIKKIELVGEVCNKLIKENEILLKENAELYNSNLSLVEENTILKSSGYIDNLLK